MRKAVLTGCGGISGAWFGALKQFDDVEIVGLVDLNPEAITNTREKHGLTPKAEGDNLSKVIEKSGADLVFDCTVPEAHKSVTLTALSAGCDIMGEKPMASTLEDAREMVDAAEKSGKTYAVMQNRRYLPGIAAFKTTLESGVVGEITEIHADFYIGAHFEGFRTKMDHPLLLDMAIHTFDQARYICGKDPVTVFASDWNPVNSWYKNGASAAAFFEMTGGAVFTYRGSWCSDGMNTPWEGSWRVTGEKGTVLWDGSNDIRGEIPVNDEGLIRQLDKIETAAPDYKMISGHTGAIRDFLDCLKKGCVPQTVCTDNVKSVAMVHGAIKSTELKKVVTL
ncbi:MAG: Gfo/Idh/MocA family protein [Spirochaetia bacterium]